MEFLVTKNHFNLISVSKLVVDSGPEFNDKHRYIKGSAVLTVAGTGNLVGGLY